MNAQVDGGAFTHFHDFIFQLTLYFGHHFFDAGRVWRPDGAASWLNSVGFGLALTRDLRVDFGYKLDDIPDSFQVVLRLGHTF